MTVAVVPVSTECAACGRAMTNDIDARAGLDQACRAQFNYRRVSALDAEDRTATEAIIHSIAQNKLRGDPLREAIFRLYEMGFEALAKRIGQRVGHAARPEGVPENVPPHVDVTLELSAKAQEVEPPPPPPLPPLPFTPTAGQEQVLEATRRMMATNSHGALVVVGYAGTGKTTMLQFVAREHGIPACIAPTGKAALRIRETTGLDASTIHRFIYRPIEDPQTGQTKFVRKTPEEIEAQIPRSRLLVLDEASMVGPDVWNDVIAVSKHHDLRLLVVGDGFQLPPVQAPNAPPFSVLLPAFAEQLGAQRVEMTEVLRQAQDSPIIRASMQLRKGIGIHALNEIKKIQHNEIANVCLAVHQAGGVTICHRNATRYGLNSGIRQMLGIHDEMPQPGEPLLVLKNDAALGLVNGETVQFSGWAKAPESVEPITDRWKPDLREATRFGATRVNNGKMLAVVSVEELHGRLQSSVRAISSSAAKWARRDNVFNSDQIAPHLAANFGYAYTAHKSQGSQWPYVFIILETSIRLNEEEGRRWLYTALTRSQVMAAVYPGNVW